MIVGYDIMIKGKSNILCIHLKKNVIIILGIGILQNNAKIVACEKNVFISNLNLN